MQTPIIVRAAIWLSLLIIGALGQQIITDQKIFFGGNNGTLNNDAYNVWLQEKGSFYDDAAFIPLSTTLDSGAAIHWRIRSGKIYLAVASRATGWVGFGLAEAGGMKGADIVYYTASTNKLVDAYVLDVIENGPQVDDCQDWELRDARSSGGFLIFEAVRDLDTGDAQDRAIIDDGNPGNVPAHRIIAAWGDSDQISYHGPTNRVRSAVRFFGHPDDSAIFYETMKAQADGYFDIRAVNYTVKQLDTEYKHFCFSRDALVALGAPDQPIQVIGWEPVVDEASAQFVHHFLVYGSQNTSEGIPYSGTACEKSTIYLVGYVWAPGESPFGLPDNVGAPYMDESGYQSLSLEIHYNNPDLVPNIVDNSGVRFYYTTTLRDNDLFVYQFGDPLVRLQGELVGGNIGTSLPSSSSLVVASATSLSGIYRHTFDCPTSCTSLTLPQPVTVVREYLHMHKTGVRINNHQIRDGEVVRTGFVDFWDFYQQGNEAVVQQPFEVLPGDTFQTRCYYEPSNTTVFGLSSQNEMCIAYLFFYRPRAYGPLILDLCGYNFGFTPCQSNHSKDALTLTSDIGRVFGNPSGNCSIANNPNSTGAVPNQQAASVSSGSASLTLQAVFNLMMVATVFTM